MLLTKYAGVSCVAMKYRWILWFVVVVENKVVSLKSEKEDGAEDVQTSIRTPHERHLRQKARCFTMSPLATCRKPSTLETLRGLILLCGFQKYRLLRSTRPFLNSTRQQRWC
jgi:hypothetical protein